ncbi:hypothetical protein GQ600_15780 [Phytophthora cactorum]|nr:hypothetical protein GQ600_15780 [Phytophthora cactorum]
MYMLTQTECIQGHCATGMKCGNQRMQDGQQAMLALQNIEGKGIALVADQVINRDELVHNTWERLQPLAVHQTREKVLTASSSAGETCCEIFAKRDIHPGDELTIYYGKDPRAPTSRSKLQRVCVGESSMMY